MTQDSYDYDSFDCGLVGGGGVEVVEGSEPFDSPEGLAGEAGTVAVGGSKEG